MDDVRDNGKVAGRACEPETIIPFQSRVVWSPLFDERPPSYQFTSMHGLKRISSGRFSDAELPAGWKSAEQKMRQLIPYSSDVKVAQEFRSCRMETHYSSSSDEERRQATNVESGVELKWVTADRQHRQLYEDISEMKESSSDSNGNFHRGASRHPYSNGASTSSGGNGLDRRTAQRTSRKADRPIKANGRSMGSIQRPWAEGTC